VEDRLRRLTGRTDVLDAVRQHPYGRFVAGTSRGLRGLSTPDGQGVVWCCVGPFGPSAYALGDPSTVEALLPHAQAAGLLDGIGRFNLPGGVQVPPGFALREAWDYRWLPSRAALVAPPPVDLPVRSVADEEAINTLLDAAYPDTELRPGSPLVSAWYGIHDGHRLVACAADRSAPSIEPDAVPTGVIGGVAVHPDFRGRGLAAAVTAAVATLLFERYEQVGLGVTEGNERATAVYERLGFTGVHHVLGVRPT
jgi:ribosomal protein S18 acetylase RimI-like enzyme